MKKYFFSFLILICSISVFSQGLDPLLKISDLQVKSDSFYNSGLFKTQLTWKKGKKEVEDNNIFFTALTLYTLQSLADSLSVTQQAIVDSIYNRAKDNFNFYKNRNGEITYNFYQVRPIDKPFPNLKRFSKMEVAKLPDDLDDTSVLYLIQETDDSLNTELKSLMDEQVYKNLNVKSTFKRYRDFKAYRTWFADKMKQDIDICVNSNVLLLMLEKKMELNPVDYASMGLIMQMILDDTHKKHKDIISPFYSNTSIILYHVSRLVSIANHKALNIIRPKLVSDILSELEKVDNEMERLILITSLFRLGNVINYSIDLEGLEHDMESFYWFNANSFSNRNLLIRKTIGRSNFLSYLYKSEAYYWSLVLELQTISQGKMIKSTNDGKVFLTRETIGN